MKFTKKVSNPISVTTFLLQGMSSYDKHRGVDVVHSSDLTKGGNEKFCPREYALLHTLGKAKKGMPISASLRHTFDMGRDIEARVQNDYLGDRAVGHWTCGSCGLTRTWQKRPKAGCDREDINCRWRYGEVKVQHNGVIGGFDLIVDVGKPLLRLIELKTMIKDEFVKLEAPLAEHRERTILYMYLLRHSAYGKEVNTDKASVIYVAKSFGKFDKEQGAFSPFKEFEIQFDEATVEAYIQRSDRFGTYLTTGEMPVGICTTSTCGRAKNCSVRSDCFSGHYKAGKAL